MAIFGDTLRQARAYKGVTLKEAEQATRINRHHLAALEEEQFASLPPPIYQRGIVKNYATYLDLDPNKLLTMFEEAQGTLVEAEVGPAVKPLDMPSHWAPNFAIIAFMVVMSAIVFAWLYSAYFAPGEAIPTATNTVPTVTPVDPSEYKLPTSQASPEAAKQDAAGPTRKARRTATPTEEPRAEPTEEPTAEPTATKRPRPTRTPTPEPADEEAEAAGALVEDGAAEVAAADEDVAEAESEEPAVEEEPVEDTAETQGDGLSLSFRGAAYVSYVEISGDGELLYAGELGEGQYLGPFEATTFSVYTTDAGNTWIDNLGNDDGEFIMGEGEMGFPLP